MGKQAGQGWPKPVQVYGRPLLYQPQAVFPKSVFCDFVGYHPDFSSCFFQTSKSVQVLKSSKTSKCVLESYPLLCWRAYTKASSPAKVIKDLLSG